MQDSGKCKIVRNEFRNLNFGGRHVPVINLEHENGHGRTINFGVTVIMSPVWPMPVGFLSRTYDLLKVLVPCSPVFLPAAYAGRLKAGLGVVVPFVNVYALPFGRLVGDDPFKTFLSFLRFGVFPNLKAEKSNDTPEQRMLLKKAAQDGMVLLKNEGLLPLNKNISSLGVIGPNAKKSQIVQIGKSNGKSLIIRRFFLRQF